MAIQHHLEGGVHVYTTEVAGVSYRAQELHGGWWVAGQRMLPKPRCTFSPKGCQTLGEVAAICPAFFGIEDVPTG